LGVGSWSLAFDDLTAGIIDPVVPPLRRVLAFALFAILAASASAVAQDASFARAVAAQQAGNVSEAEAEYRRFLAAHPASVEARSNLAVVLMQLGRYEEAIAEYRQALEAAPSNLTVRVNLGLAYYKAMRLDAAVQEFEAVLAAQPESRQARLLAADCHLRLGRPDRAVMLLEPLESSATDDPALIYLLGMAYLDAGHTGKGQLLIDRILRHGDSAEARVLMGVAKQRAGDLGGAVEDLKQAVAVNPDLPGVRGLYGAALLEAGNPDMARGEFEAELSRNPLDFDANLYMGVLLKGEQEYDGAVRHFERALGVRPGDLPTRFQIASIALARQDTAAAAASLEAIVAEAPSFLEAHVALATAYYRLQRREDAERERAIVQRLTEEKEARTRRQAETGRKPPG
jgi:tetratricopeptide (TPR) repeat protein